MMDTATFWLNFSVSDMIWREGQKLRGGEQEESEQYYGYSDIDVLLKGSQVQSAKHEHAVSMQETWYFRLRVLTYTYAHKV